MSTAGKVLVVLILLLVPVWIILVSGVASVNTEATKQISELKQQVAKLEEDLAKTERDIQGLKDQISLEQRATSENLAVIRSRLAEYDRARTDVFEIQDRAELDLELIKNSLKGAQEARDQRVTELKNETQAKADAEAEVAKLKTETADLMDQLEKLRDDFKSTLESNRQLVERLQQAERKRVARPSSLTPSS
jgi:chromosome segregation ATPase